MTRIIDTHVHCWDLEKAAYPWLAADESILNRTWRIEEIEEERKKAGVVAGVLVQAAGNLEDTELMLDIANRSSWIKGVVGWLPLTNPRETQRLLEDRFSKEKYFKGVRHQVHDEKDPEWLLQPPVLESLQLLSDKNIPYDMVGILPAHLRTVIKLTEKIPGLRLVLDHLNWPPIASGEKFGEWGDLIKVAAQHKNLYAKISGLGTASGNFQYRSTAGIQPYVAFAIELFGSRRCFCGSDWPVSMLAATYTQTWNQVKNMIQQLLPGAERNQVFFSTAKNFYSLETDE